MSALKVPADFVWGAAASSYQIEGHPLADGAAASIWHTFSHTPGKIADNTTGDIACDHYHRYSEDIDHMRELGLKAYRLSISWPRIMPAAGTINPKGMDFYDRLIDTLLDSGIEPYITIFHWETPQWVEDAGGFSRRQAVDHLGEYGLRLFTAFGDRVKFWITINEPLSYAVYGYFMGIHAPGKKMKIKQTLAASHHLLLGHSRLVSVFRQTVKHGKIGIAEAQIWIKPLNTRRERDLRAARLMDAIVNRLYIDPILKGEYPPEVIRRFGRFLPPGFEDDLAQMQVPVDFVGLNYYTTQSYRYSLLTPFTHAKETSTPEAKRSAMWEIDQQGLYCLLVRLKEEYGNPACYITENGFPLSEQENIDPLADDERISYLNDHIDAALRAKNMGVDLRGYFVWSLTDNFEWQHGYRMRFGLIRVNFETLERTWRKSAYWYRDLIRESASH